MRGRIYSRGERKLEKMGKDRKETDFVKNEDLTPFVDGSAKALLITDINAH